MTYQETLDYLFNALPMYQRIGGAAYKANLENTIQLCHHLGNPQKAFKSIHIAGTNGKGSTSHALASVLQEAGFKVGLYTSPHLKSFTERIKINGREIEEEEVIRFVRENKDFIEILRPSFFEMTVAMAFDHFAREQVDFAVVEVGLGGRLDSTNVIVPEISIITNIGLDHVQYLGHTLPEIAKEKAGIIKAGVPVVISETQPETQPVFEFIAEKMNAPIFFADQNFRILPVSGRPSEEVSLFEVAHHGEKYNIRLDLLGNYQKKNLTGILQAIEVINNAGVPIDRATVERGLSRVVANTGLKGRWQKLGEKPMIYCDTGHNEDGVRMVMEQIQNTPHKNLFIIWGMSNDKEIDPVLRLLPKDATYFFCEAHIPRAMSAETLSKKAADAGLIGTVALDVNEALRQAHRLADKDDFIFVGGSTFVVAELENL